MNREILRALKPAYCISYTLGTSPYRLVKDDFGNVQCQLPTWKKLRSIVKTFVLIFVLKPLQDALLDLHSANKVTVNIHSIEDYCLLFCTSLCLLLNCWRSGDMLLFMQKIDRVDTKLKNFAEKTDYKELRFTVLSTTLFYFIAFAISSITDLVIEKELGVLVWVLWTWMWNLAIHCQLVSFILIIKTQFESINNNLKRISKISNIYNDMKRTSRIQYELRKTLNAAKELFRCRCELFEASKLLNRFYGIQCALQIPFYFLSASCKSYYIIASVMECRCFEGSQFVELVWLSIIVASIFGIFFTCNQLYKEVFLFKIKIFYLNIFIKKY